MATNTPPTIQKLTTTMTTYRAAEAALEHARQERDAAITAAAADPAVKQRDIVEATGYTREYIRRIVSRPSQTSSDRR